MATLNVRNLSDVVHARLRVRAAKAGRSMEAEVRAILEKACESEGEPAVTPELQDWVDRLYGTRKPKKVVAGLIRERRKAAARE